MYKRILLSIFISIYASCTYTQTQQLDENDHLLVRVFLNEHEDLQKLNGYYLDLVTRTVNHYADVITCAENLDHIIKLGFITEILDYGGKDLLVDPEYHTYEEYMSLMHDFASNYPGITQLDTLGTSQVKEYQILSLKISDNPEQEEDEMTILYDGLHHAREPVSMETCLVLIEHLLINYGIDPDITAWIDTTEIFIVPMLNPDGWMYIVDENLSDPWWRKNMRDNNVNGIFEPDFDGVDLNQNYDLNWDNGIHDPSAWIYCGPYAFSETETQAKRDLVLDQNFVMSITYHSCGEEVYYLQGSLNNPIPDTSLYFDMAAEIASRIPKFYSGTYELLEDDYCESGYSDCWMYLTQGTFEFTVETAHKFIPNGPDAISIAYDNIEGALYLLERINGPGITGHVTDIYNGNPVAATITILDYDNESIVPRSSDETYGRYTRLLNPGTYSLEISNPEYQTRIIPDVIVGNNGITWQDIQLTPIGTGFEELFSDSSVYVFPNPFGTTVNIRYTIPKTQYLNLSIYDVYGRVIETFTEGMKESGVHIVNWNAEGMPSGIYFVRLFAGNKSQTINIIKY